MRNREDRVAELVKFRHLFLLSNLFMLGLVVKISLHGIKVYDVGYGCLFVIFLC